MTYLQYRDLWVDTLSDIYIKEEALSLFYRVIEDYAHISKINFQYQKQNVISEKLKDKLNAILQRLQKHEPIQYILGYADFCTYVFRVNQHCLIPRGETEEMVQSIVRQFSAYSSKLSILDMGTGSGCIIISLALQLGNKHDYEAWDISQETLSLAQSNANQYDLHHIGFKQQDVLQNIKIDKSYDIIVSNPPYVRVSEKKFMKKNVLEYEPVQALFVSDENPLLFYERIASFALNSLNHNGVLWFEINEVFGNEVRNMLVSKSFHQVRICQDLYGKNRFVTALKK